MANLLHEKWPAGTYDPISQDDNENIIERYQEKLEAKKSFEKKFWDLTSNEFDHYDQDHEREFKNHHKVFTKKHGVKGILHFLTA